MVPPDSGWKEKVIGKYGYAGLNRFNYVRNLKLLW